MKQFVDLGNGPYILEINTYYPEKIDGAKLLKSCQHKKFDDLNKLKKYAKRAQSFNNNVSCRVFIDITNLHSQEALPL